MIKINQIKLPIRHSASDLWNAAAKRLRVKSCRFSEKIILKKSIDARKKPDIMFVYTVAVSLDCENEVLEQFSQDSNILFYERKKNPSYHCGTIPLRYRPVIAGSGPCGLFCAWKLAQKDMRPL